MKSLWAGVLIVTGLSFYNPKFIMVFSVILFINLVMGNRKDLIKLVRCLKSKQQLLSLKRINADIEKEINTCYLNVSRNSKDKSK